MRRVVPFALAFVVVAWTVVVVRTDGPTGTGPVQRHWAPHLVDPSTSTTAPPAPVSGPATPGLLPPVTGPARIYPL